MQAHLAFLLVFHVWEEPEFIILRGHFANFVTLKGTGICDQTDLGSDPATYYSVSLGKSLKPLVLSSSVKHACSPAASGGRNKGGPLLKVGGHLPELILLQLGLTPPRTTTWPVAWEIDKGIPGSAPRAESPVRDPHSVELTCSTALPV